MCIVKLVIMILAAYGADAAFLLQSELLRGPSENERSSSGLRHETSDMLHGSSNIWTDTRDDGGLNLHIRSKIYGNFDFSVYQTRNHISASLTIFVDGNPINHDTPIFKGKANGYDESKGVFCLSPRKYLGVFYKNRREMYVLEPAVHHAETWSTKTPFLNTSFVLYCAETSLPVIKYSQPMEVKTKLSWESYSPIRKAVPIKVSLDHALQGSPIFKDSQTDLIDYAAFLTSYIHDTFAETAFNDTSAADSIEGLQMILTTVDVKTASNPVSSAVFPSQELFLGGIHGSAAGHAMGIILTYNHRFKNTGMAYRGGICSAESNLATVQLCESHGRRTAATLSDIVAAAVHEVGHLLGSYHDGDKLEDDLSCAAGLYVMNSKRVLKENFFNFSPCSRKKMHSTILAHGGCFLPRPPNVNEPGVSTKGHFEDNWTSGNSASESTINHTPPNVTAPVVSTEDHFENNWTSGNKWSSNYPTPASVTEPVVSTEGHFEDSWTSGNSASESTSNRTPNVTAPAVSTEGHFEDNWTSGNQWSSNYPTPASVTEPVVPTEGHFDDNWTIGNGASESTSNHKPPNVTAPVVSTEGHFEDNWTSGKQWSSNYPTPASVTEPVVSIEGHFDDSWTIGNGASESTSNHTPPNVTAPVSSTEGRSEDKLTNGTAPDASTNDISNNNSTNRDGTSANTTTQRDTNVISPGVSPEGPADGNSNNRDNALPSMARSRPSKVTVSPSTTNRVTTKKLINTLTDDDEYDADRVNRFEFDNFDRGAIRRSTTVSPSTTNRVTTEKLINTLTDDDEYDADRVNRFEFDNFDRGAIRRSTKPTTPNRKTLCATTKRALIGEEANGDLSSELATAPQPCGRKVLDRSTPDTITSLDALPGSEIVRTASNESTIAPQKTPSSPVETVGSVRTPDLIKRPVEQPRYPLKQPCSSRPDSTRPCGTQHSSSPDDTPGLSTPALPSGDSERSKADVVLESAPSSRATFQKNSTQQIGKDSDTNYTDPTEKDELKTGLELETGSLGSKRDGVKPAVEGNFTHFGRSKPSRVGRIMVSEGEPGSNEKVKPLLTTKTPKVKPLPTTTTPIPKSARANLGDVNLDVTSTKDAVSGSVLRCVSVAAVFVCAVFSALML